MPPLKACCRTWEFGSDDLVFPGVVSVFGRFLWLVGVVAGVISFRSPLSCQKSHYLARFSFAVMAMILLTIIVEAAITIFSARGTIIRAKPRKPIVHLLHFRIFVFLLEILLLIIGTVFAFQPTNRKDYNTCHELDNAVLITQIIVGIDWAILFLIVMFLLVYLDPCHCYSAKVHYNAVVEDHSRIGATDSQVVQQHWNITHSVWEKRFRVACCMAGSDDSHQHAYREVAEIFSHLFCDTNVVLSDIAAGMVLLQKEHLAREKERRNHPSPEERGLVRLNFSSPAEVEVFKEALHYIKFAMAPYSWPLYAYMNPLVGCCKLMCILQCCPCKRKARPHVIKDNSCFCHFAGLRQISGLNEMDIMYASFENDLFRTPFYVSLNHEMKTVVVAIRGTLSMHDIITDLIASTQPIEFPEHPTFLVHKGMLKTAVWIKEKLEELDILDDAFNKVSNYNLIITGHSLGSGVACVLSMLLRGKYPNLHCYCFSPTGALVNHAAAEYTKSFVTSVTLGQDMVARFSQPTSHLLKEDLIRALENCRKPKCQILVEGMLETICTCIGRPVVIEDGQGGSNIAAIDQNSNIPIVTNPNDSLEVTPLLRRNLSVLRPKWSPSSGDESSHPLIPLFPPGKIIHLVDVSDTSVSFCGTRKLQACWAPKENFRRIIVSPDMIRDHLPNIVQDAMEYIWKEKAAEIEDAVIPVSVNQETAIDVEDGLLFHP